MVTNKLPPVLKRRFVQMGFWGAVLVTAPVLIWWGAPIAAAFASCVAWK